MSQYRYYLCQLTTGRIWEEVELINVSAERSLMVGGFTAQLNLNGMSTDRRILLLGRTTPGLSTVLITRDGNVMGEWIIWKRTRRNDASPVELTGAELLSYIDHRLIGYPVDKTWTQVEQLDLASALFQQGVAGTYDVHLGSVAATVAPYVPSGKLRDRTYTLVEAFTGQRLRELSEVIDGFEYYIDTQTDPARSNQYVLRQLQLKYPLAGNQKDWSFYSPGINDRYGNVIVGGLAEDGSVLASEAWALGGTYQSGANTIQVYGGSNDLTLVTKYGYPFLQASGSWTSVTQQPTIQGHADALLASRQDSEFPAALTINQSAGISVNDFALGDRVKLIIAPSVNFPEGQELLIRIVGWTLKPPVAGPDILEVQTVNG